MHTPENNTQQISYLVQNVEFKRPPENSKTIANFFENVPENSGNAGKLLLL